MGSSAEDRLGSSHCGKEAFSTFCLIKGHLDPKVPGVTLSAETGAADTVEKVGSSTFPSNPDPSLQ